MGQLILVYTDNVFSHSNCMTDHHHSPYTHCSSEKCHFQLKLAWKLT